MGDYIYKSDEEGEIPTGVCREIAFRIDGVIDGWPQWKAGPVELDRYWGNGHIVTRDEYVRLLNEGFVDGGFTLRAEPAQENGVRVFLVDNTPCPVEPL